MSGSSGYEVLIEARQAGSWLTVQAANERTFLGYLRTSLGLSFAGVTVTQFLRLNDGLDKRGFGFYQSSRGLGAMLIGSAIVVVLAGGHRYWRQQNAMVRGKVWAAGWELDLVGFLFGAVSPYRSICSLW